MQAFQERVLLGARFERFGLPAWEVDEARQKIAAA